MSSMVNYGSYVKNLGLGANQRGKRRLNLLSGEKHELGPNVELDGC
jgi:hypothetical protein